MKLCVVLALVGSKKNTVINLRILTAVSLNMHRNILQSCYEYVT